MMHDGRATRGRGEGDVVGDAGAGVAEDMLEIAGPEENIEEARAVVVGERSFTKANEERAVGAFLEKSAGGLAAGGFQ